MEFNTGIYEPLHWSFDVYPSVVPRVRVRGVMTLFLAGSILWALVWLLYRAWQVCQTPNDILVDKLGLDIPPSPEVTLEEIAAREIRIAWKQPEFHNSIQKHIIQINSAKVGETKRAETAVTIGNLVPGHIYHICVFAVSAANFQTASAVLHIRTKPLPLSQTQQDGTIDGPTIQASVPRSTVTLVAPSAPVMAREHSGGHPQSKRTGLGRKLSPAADMQPDDSHRVSVSDDRNGTLEQLAVRLKNLQQENENMDKQVAEEDEEHNASLDELAKQRDQLKQRVKEKDEASGDLKKHVNKLESVNRTVQSEKTKRERLLQQKEAERKKRKDDIVRWQDQISQFNKEVARAGEDKNRVEQDATKQANEIREKIASEQAKMKGIDDEIQEKGGRIKKLEDERQGIDGSDNEDGRELDRIDIEKARQWETRLNHLHARYATLVNLHTQAQQQYQEAQERIKWLNNQRTSGNGPFNSLQTIDLELPQPSAIRRPRHRSSLTSNVSSPVAFPQVDTAFPRTLTYNQSNNSPTFAPSSAFFNITNGMTLLGPSDRAETVPTESDTSLPPMSPRADALLPSDLLGDEESTDLPEPITAPDLPDTTGGDDPRSPSPVSSETRSARFFASPHDSLRDIDLSLPHNEGLSPDDTTNVQSASRRLSGLFNFHRQRGKTMADGPPLLGSLKPGQSRSFPRNYDDMDPIGARRRRLSHAANWANPMSLFPRSNPTNVTADTSSDQAPSRKGPFSNIFSSTKLNADEVIKNDQGYNQFSPSYDPLDPSSLLGPIRRSSLSPRPSSTFSFDKHLPHPSTDPFGWPSSDVSAQRSSLAFDWASPSTWSRNQSRRPSIQYGSSSHLPLGMSPGEPDFLQAPHDKLRPLQAPIGTRPSSSHRPVTPKLNPAAPTFKTLFKKAEKDKDKSTAKDLASKSQEFEFYTDDLSPPPSRRSRDSRALSGAAESFDSLDLVPSSSPSDNVSTKESFIQKITRKSSSSKFNLSWKDRGGIFSKKNDSIHSEIDIEGNHNDEAQLGKSVDSTVSSTLSADRSTTRSGRHFFSRKPKKDKASSEAGETGDEELPEEEYEYVRTFEQPDSLLPESWIVVRIDGRGFHRLSDKYGFEKPNDRRALDLMNAAAVVVMKDLPELSIAYGVSDEYSFAFHPSCQLFDRRSAKLVSTIVSGFTAAYVMQWPAYFPDKPLEISSLPTFDGRAVLYPNARIFRDYMSWRQVDCHINNLYNTTFWSLVLKGGMTNIEAEKELQGTISSDKNEILFTRFGINYNNEDDIYKKGSVVYRQYQLVDPSTVPTSAGDHEEDQGIANVKELSRTQQEKLRKLRRKAQVVVDHVDIIKDEFWQRRPWILSGKPGKVPAEAAAE
ncbi:uncharacterized protein TRUGW13939_09028 [Talaromyces rugulosus]|uniref:tRNA(His) guanylyltransferase n=1 Tax=Talaromyces rugulosus TaxID=121627 RepID=A0A7H8R687_TALRU|nr:uncharacterized protein TRUGW13939_09028 [Talaromyces rugulosus]QKX61872.1 hypothetical protein TRUGW13939_09028 [Talaromyces rugulosus]